MLLFFVSNYLLPSPLFQVSVVTAARLHFSAESVDTLTMIDWMHSYVLNVDTALLVLLATS